MFGRLRSHSSHINYPVQSDALKMESLQPRRPLTSPPPPFFLHPTELFCMGFSFSAFFFFVLITRTAHLDYNSGFFLSVFRPADVQ